MNSHFIFLLVPGVARKEKSGYGRGRSAPRRTGAGILFSVLGAKIAVRGATPNSMKSITGHY